MSKLTTPQVARVRAALVKKQGGVCEVCGQPFTNKDPAVLDHCHSTGHIRGALHRSCNGQEGRVLIKALRSHAGVSAHDYIIGLGKYYEKYKTPQTKYIHPTFKTEDEKRLERNKKARQKRARAKAAKQLGA